VKKLFAALGKGEEKNKTHIIVGSLVSTHTVQLDLKPNLLTFCLLDYCTFYYSSVASALSFLKLVLIFKCFICAYIMFSAGENVWFSEAGKTI